MGVAWLAGIFPPIATAFAPDGALRPPAAGFLEFLRDGGLDGVVALGSNGEAAHLTEAERLRYISWVREALPAPLRLLSGTGGGWIVRLTGHANIAGLKHSSGDIGRLPGLRAQLGPDFVLLAGAGEKLVDALGAGADGAIAALANLAPHTCAGIRKAWLEQHPDQARQLQRTIAPLGAALSGGLRVAGVRAGRRPLGGA